MICESSDWLLQTLEAIRADGEKAIIFCEFRAIQRLLHHYIEQVFGFAPDIINGEVAAAQGRSDSRQKRLRAFQQKPGFGVIILSPIAVGFGVNIQGANHVVHYTRTWNPAKEDQATDRAYRIGQTKTVYVYCPIVQTNDFKTFDVKLDQLLTFKRSLAEDMLNGAGDIRPGEFEIGEVVPGGSAALGDECIGHDQLSRLNPIYFEALIAALWQKRGFRMVARTPVRDGGIDVVAIDGTNGELVQCKTPAREDAALSWDAIKDVVTGAARYRQLYAGVSFTMACATNQAFNENARSQAHVHNVTLYELTDLLALLDEHTIMLSQVERYLYADWQQSAA